MLYQANLLLNPRFLLSIVMFSTTGNEPEEHKYLLSLIIELTAVSLTYAVKLEYVLKSQC